MNKTRVYQIAEEVGMSNKDILAKIKELGIKVENEKSELEEDEVELLMDILEEEKSDENVIKVDGTLTVQQLAEALEKPATEVIMKLMKMGTMASLNQEVNFEIASHLASEYGFTLAEGVSDEEAEEEIEALMQIEEDKEEYLKPRP
ncbi:translation initiation factor IF-2, partial [Clostridium perfringens]